MAVTALMKAKWMVFPNPLHILQIELEVGARSGYVCSRTLANLANSEAAVRADELVAHTLLICWC